MGEREICSVSGRVLDNPGELAELQPEPDGIYVFGQNTSA